jgi:hypothetical protein
VTPTPYIAVQGTHGWDEDPNVFQWWESLSPFAVALGKLGCVPLDLSLFFEWSTNLDGLLLSKKTTWKAGGKALRYYVGDQFPEGLPYEKRNLIAHSHGGQCVFYAAAEGLRIRNLITVGTPVRGDMAAVVNTARPNIGYWLHICDTKHDFTSIAGAIFDGRVKVEHQFALADANDNCRDLGIGHSEILNETARFGLWESRGWARALQRA